MSSKEELKALNIKRGVIKGRLTRFNNFLKSSNDVNELKIRLDKLPEVLSEFEKIQTEIDIVDDTDSHDAEWKEFEDMYFKLSTEAQNKIQLLTKAGIGNVRLKCETTDGNNESNWAHPRFTLPVIKLPSYSGDYNEWASFHDSFKSLIHENPNLSDCQKFHYLKLSLKDDAANILQSLEGSAENYKIGWDLLVERFQNKKYLVNKHVAAIFNLIKLDKESSSQLRRLIDDVQKHIRALKGLGQPTESWDTLIIYLIVIKLDKTTHRLWESEINSSELPTLSDLTQFLKKRSQILEAVESKPSTSASNQPQRGNSPSKSRQNPKGYIRTTNYVSSVKKCSLCTNSHPLFSCETFKSLSVSDREKEVKKLGLCFNCLSSGDHKIKYCRAGSCKICGKRHNTLLHYSENVNNSVNSKSNPSTSNSDSKATDVVVATSRISNQGVSSSSVLLSTALVSILDHRGTPHPCRVLLDSGSQSNFATERVVKKLGLPSTNLSVEVSGIGTSKTRTSKVVQCIIKSRYNSFSATIDCVVLPSITQDLPTVSISQSQFKVPQNVQLADPYFNQPSEIDLLIGAELFFDLLRDGRLKFHDSSPTLQNTVLGWVISGKVTQQFTTSHITTTCNLSTLNDINKIVHRFWEIEDCVSERQHTGHDKLCEELFVKTTIRNDHGRYCVNIPLKGDVCELGESRDSATRRFVSMERRLSSKPDMRSQYIQFMKEYESLGHMKEITPSEADSSKAYYIPHHAVVKNDSTTTKLRVVFDASAKTSSGVSLNDISMVGPTIQSDLVSIVIRFRTHPFVITGDIEKMYRQVNINPTQQNLQLILWRERQEDPIKTFKLQTVTYGTASAPYLATRTLKQLALDEKSSFPTATEVLMNDFYVDDVMSGANTVKDAKNLLHDLNELLHRGGFHLRKWTSNHLEILSDVPLEDRSSDCFEINQDTTVKTLGLIWNPRQDVFQFSIHEETEINNVTKRTILSAIGRIFDPLGIIGPVILKAKLIMQQLWVYQLGWDEVVPKEMLHMWTQFRRELPLLSKIRIPRGIVPKVGVMSRIELHGFSDASEAAYGACVYLKCVDHDGNISVHLITSKSRVAPLKKISLPRLELCGAVLLTELCKTTRNALHLHVDSVSYYTDSTITLAWIQAPSTHWTTFVANRVSKIQTNTDASLWKHVQSGNNPADHLSRGLLPSKIIDANLYWKGPAFLHTLIVPPDEPICFPDCDQMPERRHLVLSNITTNEQVIEFGKFSRFVKLQRVMSYCLRFIHNSQPRNPRLSGQLSVSELQTAERTLVKLVQRESFSTEIQALRLGKELSKTSRLISLSPFLDQHDIIRVGGRLRHSGLTPDQIHPIVLPKSHIFTDLIAKHFHIKSLHAGPQLLLNIIRQKYWPINGRNLVSKIYHQCIPCFKVNPKLQTQIMGDLPKSRVQATLRPFYTTGVDYCGPFNVRINKRRGSALTKCYIALFVCFSTKAVHLEVVDDLTTSAFIGALKRFMSRRGKPKDMYSDNGKNFVGAQRELQELCDLQQSDNFKNTVSTFLAQDGITWHFIPPKAPHFGGLWESSVKLVKLHLKRTMGASVLAYTQFVTLLTQIEACINSRPLIPLSDQPTDLTALTPSHFLIGDVLTTNPEPSLSSLPITKLSHWQQIQQLFQHFWSRWSLDYLNSLQQRRKWTHSSPNLKIGDLVVIKEDSVPPLQWRMARIIELHPAEDNIVRVVTTKTSSGVLKRPISKLCLLPVSNTDNIIN